MRYFLFPVFFFFLLFSRSVGCNELRRCVRFFRWSETEVRYNWIWACTLIFEIYLVLVHGTFYMKIERSTQLITYLCLCFISIRASSMPFTTLTERHREKKKGFSLLEAVDNHCNCSGPHNISFYIFEVAFNSISFLLFCFIFALIASSAWPV